MEKRKMDMLSYCVSQAKKSGMNYGEYMAATTEKERKKAYQNYICGIEDVEQKKINRRREVEALRRNCEPGFNERLNQKMRERHIETMELAARTGINDGSIRRYKHGQQIPKYENLEPLSKALGVTIEWLLTGA